MPNSKLKLSLNLSQKLKITPQLKQAIKMLQLSRMDLEKEINKELDENPLLEIDHDKEKENTSSEKKEVDWENYLKSTQTSKTYQSFKEEKKDIDYDKFNAKAQSLYDYLSWQISCHWWSEEEEKIAKHLAGFVDEKGYVEESMIENFILEKKQDKDLVLEVLNILQKEMDPIGVFSRNLKECLLIQAKHFYPKDFSDLKLIIENHLKDLENQNFNLIGKALNLPTDPTKKLCKIIQSLDPKPARMFSNEKVSYAIPDVFIDKIDGEYKILFNHKGVPELKISSHYKNLLISKKIDEKTKNYIEERLRSADWFCKAIHQRKKTIYKVVESILKFQKDFFKKGKEHLKPMILKDVALDIQMHESTVSRVTNQKYVHTPYGVFELKYFFNSKMGEEGNFLGSQSVKEKIKKIVLKEDKKKPFSDQKIVDILKYSGLKVARRTVSKYRQSLGILSASKRKKI